MNKFAEFARSEKFDLARSILEKLFLGSISAISFLTVFGAIISPLPIIFAMNRLGRIWGYLFLLLNTALVFVLAGKLAALIFICLIGTIAIGISELPKFQIGIEKVVLISLTVILLLGSLWVVGYSVKNKINPITHASTFTTEWVENFAKHLKEQNIDVSRNSAAQEIVNDPKETAKTLLTEFPSTLVIGIMLMIILNIFFVIRVNPNNFAENIGMTRLYFQTWKSPEYLVFPVIVCGIFILFEVPYATKIAINLIKIIGAIYFFQGLSVVYFVFERLKVTVFWRTIGYLMFALTLSPLLAALGLFDQWLDLRTKFTKQITSGGNDESNID